MEIFQANIEDYPNSFNFHGKNLLFNTKLKIDPDQKLALLALKVLFVPRNQLEGNRSISSPLTSTTGMINKPD
jgi:hypothetical protein